MQARRRAGLRPVNFNDRTSDPKSRLGDLYTSDMVWTGRIYSCFIYTCKNRTGWRTLNGDEQGVPICSEECLVVKREWEKEIEALAKKCAVITNVGTEGATVVLAPAAVAMGLAAAVEAAQQVRAQEPAKEESPTEVPGSVPSPTPSTSL